MSGICFVSVDGRGFWSLSDALGVWMSYLVDQIDQNGLVGDPWLAETVAQWRLVVANPDLGVNLEFDSVSHRMWVLENALIAREIAIFCGDISVARLREWEVMSDAAAAYGHARRSDGVHLSRVLEVADGFKDLVDRCFPQDPPEGWWFLGTGQGMEIISWLPGQ